MLQRYVDEKEQKEKIIKLDKLQHMLSTWGLKQSPRWAIKTILLDVG